MIAPGLDADIAAGEARAYAAWAQAAYDPDHQPDIRVGATEIYIRPMPNGRLGLVWCGSTDWADWRANLRFARRWSAELGCWVHGGYLADHRATVDRVVALLAGRSAAGGAGLSHAEEAGCADGAPAGLDWPEWEAVGHSRGGGQAQLMAAAMAGHGHPPARIVTFGAPRVGFGGLARRLAGIPHARLVCGVDAVPHMPPPLAGWRHSGPAIPVGRPHDPYRDHLMETGYMPALTALPSDTPLAPSKPWYASRGIVGGLAAVAASALAFIGVDPALVAPLAQAFGLDLPAANPLLVQALTVLAGGGGALAAIGRAKAKAVITSGSSAAPSATLPLLPLFAVGLALAATVPLGACSTGLVMPGPLADIAARSPLHQVASGRVNLNAVLAAAAVYVQSGQATGKLVDTVRDLAESAAAAVDKADIAVAGGASQTVVTVILSAAHRDLRELATAMVKEVRGSVLAAIATASVERGLGLGANLTLGATAAAQTRQAAWEAEARDPTDAEMAALTAETAALLAIIRGP